jgi:hypothetical protein
VITHGRALLTGCCRYIYMSVIEHFITGVLTNMDVYYICIEARSGYMTQIPVFFFRWNNNMIDVYCIVPGGTIFLLWGEFVTFRFSPLLYMYMQAPLLFRPGYSSFMLYITGHCIIYFGVHHCTPTPYRVFIFTGCYISLYHYVIILSE